MPNIIRLGGGGGSVELTGNALPADVLTGKTFYSADPEAKQTGSMTNRAGTSQAATSEQASNQYRLKLPANGYYDTAANIYRTYANVASDIGLTAGILAKGSTVLGIAGSMVADFKYASGTYTFASNKITISGLSFMPRDIWIIPTSSFTGSENAILLRVSFNASGALVSANTTARTTGFSESSGLVISNISVTLSAASATSSGATFTYSGANTYKMNTPAYYTYFATGLG